MQNTISSVELVPGISVPKMGIGTWGMGGYMKKSPYNDDENDIKQIQYQLDQGLTMVDAWLAQGEGHAVELIARAIKDRPRDSYFIVAKLDVKNFMTRADLEETVDQYLSSLGIDHLDMLQIHKPQYDNLSAQDTVEEINRMVDVGKTKLLGICNANVEKLQEVLKFTKHPMTSNEINYSVIDRSYQENGTIDFCQQNGIKILAYKPLARGMVNYLGGVDGSQLFKELSVKYDKTVNQIAFNWLLSKPDFLVWMKSANRSHINENLDSMSFTMDAADHQGIEEWRYQR